MSKESKARIVLTPEEELETIEIELLLEGIFRVYGYDFRDYAFSSLRRRIWHRIHAMQLSSVSGLQEQVLHNPAHMKALLSSLSITVTEMFRDPQLFRLFRREAVPVLRALPQLRIWHAGCSTGEEVLSMAILLHEEGLLARSRLYATDMNETSLEQARRGQVPLRKLHEYTQNYLAAGGSRDLSEYYSIQDDYAVFHPDLLEHVEVAPHNLVTDRSFNEFHVIFCRNVLIYFNKELQDQVHRLIYDSLSPRGFLVLGHRESIHFTCHADSYRPLHPSERLYRKLR
jgi:chemotaxis protein methyltransferase CheR